jgi:hypothetical protein
MAVVTLPLPVTVTVGENGAVTVESPTRVVGMSRFSERAARLTLDFGPGVHVIATDTDRADLPNGVLGDLADALDV